MANHLLKYRTFDEAIASVKGDFEAFNLQERIKNHQLIKVAKRVNYDLGLKIYKTKNVILEVVNGKAKLPDDFHTVNYLYGLGRFQTTSAVPQGTHTEIVPLKAPIYFPGSDTLDICATPNPCPIPEPSCPNPCEPCQSPNPCGCNTCNCDTWMNCKGEDMQLIQKVKYQTRKWSEFYKIQLVGDNQFYDQICPNKTWIAKHTGFIRDGHMFFSFKDGEVYLNYQGMLEDEDGNLLLLCHDEIDNYYEYAFKKKIIEILLGNNEQVNGQFVQLIFEEFRVARIRAKGIVNTPEYSEIKKVWATNREAMFRKYFKMFTNG